MEKSTDKWKKCVNPPVCDVTLRLFATHSCAHVHRVPLLVTCFYIAFTWTYLTFNLTAFKLVNKAVFSLHERSRTC